MMELATSPALQLSVTVGEPKAAAIWVAEGFGPTEAAGERVMRGGSLSFTVTLKLQVTVFPALSVAVHLTAVVPIAKRVPEGGKQLTVTGSVVGQTSSAVGVVKLTIALHWPGSAPTTRSGSQDRERHLAGVLTSLTSSILPLKM